MVRRFIVALWLSILFAPATAQVQRQFPQAALRGEIVIGQPPEVLLNTQPRRLAPGARIRAANNMIVLSGALVGNEFGVNYTLDAQGELRDVWILRPEEVAIQPWPRSVEEASAWTFDAIAQKWTRP